MGFYRESTKMPRGPKKHLKRLNAPKHWMLDKLSGNFAPRPSPGPHKLRECLPLAILLRNRLKYALQYSDVTKIMMQRLIKVDGRVRTDKTYPAGFMDVITIEKTGEFFRLLYDVKGRFVCHRIGADEAGYKLCKVKKVSTGVEAVPYLVTHDARTIRRPAGHAKVNDTVVLDINTGKITEVIKYDTGNTVMVTGGRHTQRETCIIIRHCAYQRCCWKSVCHKIVQYLLDRKRKQVNGDIAKSERSEADHLRRT